MAMQVQSFGFADGVEIQEITLRNAAGATASVITWGAVIRDLVVPSAGGPQRVVLGLNTIEDYLAHSPYFGAIAGRFANRIAGGRFVLDGRTHRLPTNERAGNTLHGGPKGFGSVPWRLEGGDESSVTLVLDSPDGDEGFPGNVRATCTYTLAAPGTLVVELGATTDAATILSLAQHSYFNLDGSADARDHEMLLNCDFITPVDPDLIPTGEIRAVAGTPFDFAASRPIRNASGQDYDINFVIAPTPDPETGLAHAVTVRSPKNGLTLDVYTDQPGVQFYDGAKVHCPVPGLDGARYGAYAGFALECQSFPDAPNRRHFPSAVLRPGRAYRQHSEYRFA